MYDVRCTPDQIKAVAAWVELGESMADVDTGGEPASEEYLALAPLDRNDN